nr:MAG TPA: Putative actin-like family [Caudoviricetes sp.]
MTINNPGVHTYYMRTGTTHPIKEGSRQCV